MKAGNNELGTRVWAKEFRKESWRGACERPFIGHGAGLTIIKKSSLLENVKIKLTCSKEIRLCQERTLYLKSHSLSPLVFVLHPFRFFRHPLVLNSTIMWPLLGVCILLINVNMVLEKDIVLEHTLNGQSVGINICNWLILVVHNYLLLTHIDL